MSVSLSSIHELFYNQNHLTAHFTLYKFKIQSKMRQKLNDLFVFHPNLDSTETIELIKSFQRGNLKHIRQLINKQNVNQSIGVCSYLPLELAIIFDHKPIFDYLVYELEANINIKNKSFETMPFVALGYQRRNYLFELLNLDTSTLYDCTNETQRTLVHEAAMFSDSETVYKLLNEFGFYKNLNQFELRHLLYDKFGCTPLYYACWFGSNDIVEQLLDCAEQTYKDEEQDDVFSSAEDNEEKCIVKFEDSSLAISILYKRFDCVKLLLTRSLNFSILSTNYSSYIYKKKPTENESTELDCWFAASMKLNSVVEFIDMCNIFHELVLNGAKFSNYTFTLLDSMNDLNQFKNLSQSENNSNNNNSSNRFEYNLYSSYFIKCLTFILNYNLEKLFNNSESKCELFLKTCFMKLNELFLLNDLFNYANEKIDQQQYESIVVRNQNVLLNLNRTNIDRFKYDFKLFLNALYRNNLSFKYFSNRNFFNFVKKRESIYHLIQTNLYSIEYDDMFDESSSDYGMSSSKCFVAEPLSLANLAKLRIKSSIRYLDNELLKQLPLPKQLVYFLGAELASGLGKSYERCKFNSSNNCELSN